MAEQKNSSQKQRDARSAGASGVTGTILPSDLAIPCWVAPLQSPTPFRQAKYSVARTSNLGADLPPPSEIQNRHKRLPALARQNRHKRLPGRRRETNELPARQIRILGIIVIHTHPQSTHCRFSKRRANVEVQALRDTVSRRRAITSWANSSWDMPGWPIRSVCQFRLRLAVCSRPACTHAPATPPVAPIESHSSQDGKKRNESLRQRSRPGTFDGNASNQDNSTSGRTFDGEQCLSLRGVAAWRQRWRRRRCCTVPRCPSCRPCTRRSPVHRNPGYWPSPPRGHRPEAALRSSPAPWPYYLGPSPKGVTRQSL